MASMPTTRRPSPQPALSSTEEGTIVEYIGTATYSPDDNKLRLHPYARLSRNDYDRVKSAGFIWAAKQDLFVAPMWTPDREDLLVELCGEIGDDDTSLLDRAEDRADRFDEYREHRIADAESARAAVDAICEHIPLGQPILVGHHSERHARKDAERIENGMRRTLKMWQTAKYWQSRAAGAIRHAKYKERPDVRARRIKTIEAEQRKYQRQYDEACKWIRAWGKLDTPSKVHEIRPGVFAEDAPRADEELRRKRALFIANYSHYSLPATPGRPYGTSLWGALNDNQITVRAAQLFALRAHGRTIANAKRWIAHCENRLTYEKAMLDEQGGTSLLAPKPRSAKSQLPLCNYRAPEGLDIENQYYRGEMLHYPQVEMTSAEYARITPDYKGTRVVGNSHRVRTTMQRSALVCVFLTDSKVHERPAAQQPPEPAARPIPMPTYRDRTPDPIQEQIDTMRDAIKTGVQVVSAPQLFPTPRDVARQVVDLADIQPGDRVLEPSAGTGHILDAVPDTAGAIVAVELNHNLIKTLRAKFQPAVVLVEHADFLEWQADAPFDRIVMNPPFSNGADIKHITRALSMLREGGRLVAICANGPRQREQLEPIADEWIDLPVGTFAEQGTNVNTAIVVISK